MGFKVNKTKADLCSYPPYVIMGEEKVGKTTLFRDLVLYKYGVPERGLLISLGNEEGFLALDDINYEEAKVWSKMDDGISRGLVEIIDEVIQTQQDPDTSIRIVGLDTLDQLVALAIKQIFEEHREIYGSYPKSINDAFGGFNRGKERVNSIIEEQISRLREANIAVFILAHTKVKSNNDIYSGITYDVITNNLESTYYKPIADRAQMIVNIVYKREFGDISEKKKKVNNTKEGDVIKKGNLVSTERMMVFCNDPFVDAGGRFSGLPQALPLSAENFLKAFEIGVKNSSRATEKEMEERKIEENKINEDIAKKTSLKEELDKKEAIAKEITDWIRVNTENSGDVVALIKKKKFKGFSRKDLESISMKDLVEVQKLLV